MKGQIVFTPEDMKAALLTHARQRPGHGIPATANLENVELKLGYEGQYAEDREAYIEGAVISWDIIDPNAPAKPATEPAPGKKR